MYRAVLARLCFFLALPWEKPRAGALVHFVRDFAFTETNSVNRLPFSEKAAAALRAAISGADTPGAFRRERVIDGGKTFLLVYSPDIAGAPITIFAENPDRDIVLEAPHPVKDWATGLQAAHLLIALGARAAIISGNNRCAASISSPCNGKTRICGGGLRAYPSSDPAHYTQSLFHQAHIALSERWPQALFVQLHGYAQADSDTLVILSNGTRERRNPDNALTGKIRDRIRISLGGAAAAVSCQDPRDRRFAYRPLCARTTVQGRHLNGSADHCRLDAAGSSGRFLHIEQQYRVRKAVAEDPLTALESGEYGAVFRALAAKSRCLKPRCAF